MGQEFLTLADPDEAEKLIKSLEIEHNTEKILLKDALNRVLAENILTSIDLPPFDRVSMDGYALQSKDTFQSSEEEPTYLRLIGSVGAGQTTEIKIKPGTCMEVATGAPKPPGSDAVVMVEFTEKDGENIIISQGVVPGQFIATQGSDVKEGDCLINNDTYLTPDKIGVLSAVGLDEVLVYTKPQVGIISTGNELVRSDQNLKHGQVYDINSNSISAAVEDCGCKPLEPIIVKDEYDLLKNSIIDLEADIIITSGGTSAGRGDILREVIDDLGEVFLHGIAFKPGKPTIVGKIGKKLIIGLPGYPVSALMVFKSFIEPFLRRMAHLPTKVTSEGLHLKISRTIRSARGRRELLLVTVHGSFAHPILKDSGAIKSLADADGYVEIPKNTDYLEENSQILVKSFHF